MPVRSRALTLDASASDTRWARYTKPDRSVSVGAELIGGDAQHGRESIGDDSRVGDEERIGHHCLLGHRFGQHLTVAVVDPSADGGDGHRLGQLGGGQQGVVLVGELLHGHQPNGQGQEDQGHHQTHGAGAPAQQERGAHRLGRGAV